VRLRDFGFFMVDKDSTSSGKLGREESKSRSAAIANWAERKAVITIGRKRETAGNKFRPDHTAQRTGGELNVLLQSC